MLHLHINITQRFQLSSPHLKSHFRRLFAECASSERCRLSRRRICRFASIAPVKIFFRLVRAFHLQVSPSAARGKRNAPASKRRACLRYWHAERQQFEAPSLRCLPQRSRSMAQVAHASEACCGRAPCHPELMQSTLSGSKYAALRPLSLSHVAHVRCAGGTVRRYF